MHDAKRLLDWSDLTFSMSMLGLNSSVTPLVAVPQEARPFPFQNWQAKRLLRLIRGSYLFELEPDGKRIIQDPLSFRDYNQRNGAAWQEWAQLKRNMLIQINSSDHNPAVVPGAKPSDSWELNTPWIKQYYVNSGGKKGYILSNSNFVAMPWANDMEAFTIALAQTIAGSVQRDLRFPDTFFTVVAPSDVFSADVLSEGGAAGAELHDLRPDGGDPAARQPDPGAGQRAGAQRRGHGELHPPEGGAGEARRRQRVPARRAGVAVGDVLDERARRRSSRRAASARRRTAAWQALRAVIPWQADSRPEIPAGELAYAFMVANPASTFMGGEQRSRRRRCARRRSARSRS